LLLLVVVLAPGRIGGLQRECCCCCYCCCCSPCGGGDLFRGLRRGGVEALELAGPAGGEAVEVAELQDAELELSPQVVERAGAAGLELGFARRGPVVVGQAEQLAGAQVDQEIDAGVKIVDPALEGWEAARVVGVGAEPGDPAVIREFVERLVERVARELVEPLRRGERIETPQEDAQQSHERHYPPGLAYAVKIFPFRTVGVWEIALGSVAWADWREIFADLSCRQKAGFVWRGREARPRASSPRSLARSSSA
jgi:hypothetical protein